MAQSATPGGSAPLTSGANGAVSGNATSHPGFLCPRHLCFVRSQFRALAGVQATIVEMPSIFHRFTRPHQLRSRLLAVITATGFMLVGPLAGVASAHISLADSDPGYNAELAVAPTSITLTFDAKVEAALVNARLLTGTDEEGIDLDNVTGNGLTTVVELALPVLATENAYKVHWTVYSFDGHVMEGRIPFTMLAPSAGVEASANDTSANDTSANGATANDTAANGADGDDGGDPREVAEGASASAGPSGPTVMPPAGGPMSSATSLALISVALSAAAALGVGAAFRRFA